MLLLGAGSILVKNYDHFALTLILGIKRSFAARGSYFDDLSLQFVRGYLILSYTFCALSLQDLLHLLLLAAKLASIGPRFTISMLTDTVCIFFNRCCLCCFLVFDILLLKLVCQWVGLVHCRCRGGGQDLEARAICIGCWLSACHWCCIRRLLLTIVEVVDDVRDVGDLLGLG